MKQKLIFQLILHYSSGLNYIPIDGEISNYVRCQIIQKLMVRDCHRIISKSTMNQIISIEPRIFLMLKIRTSELCINTNSVDIYSQRRCRKKYIEQPWFSNIATMGQKITGTRSTFQSSFLDVGYGKQHLHLFILNPKKYGYRPTFKFHPISDLSLSES